MGRGLFLLCWGKPVRLEISIIFVFLFLVVRLFIFLQFIASPPPLPRSGYVTAV